MNKIFYNNEGWVCNRYPQNIPVENENQYIEVDDIEYEKTLYTEPHFAWKVTDIGLINERYEEDPIEEILEELRIRREQECYPIINRGKLWYDNLTEKELEELNEWYNDWMNVTKTKIIPEKPKWL